MNEQAQRIAIAKASGWTQPGADSWRSPAGDEYQVMHGWQTYKDGSDILPDYLNDLNAMADAEKFLPPDAWKLYIGAIIDGLVDKTITPSNESHNSYVPIHLVVGATSRMRAAAFLRTLGLWKEIP